MHYLNNMSESVLLRIETRTFSDLQNRDLVIKWKKTLREVIMAKLYFKFGAMGSSKTAQALMTKFNYEEKGKSVLLIKPAYRRSFTDRTFSGSTGCQSGGGYPAVLPSAE